MPDDTTPDPTTADDDSKAPAPKKTADRLAELERRLANLIRDIGYAERVE